MMNGSSLQNRVAIKVQKLREMQDNGHNWESDLGHVNAEEISTEIWESSYRLWFETQVATSVRETSTEVEQGYFGLPG